MPAMAKTTCPECFLTVAVKSNGRIRLHGYIRADTPFYDPMNRSYCNGSDQLADEVLDSVIEYDACPNKSQHIRGPETPEEYDRWAENMRAHGWRNSQCESCKLWVIWWKPNKRPFH